MHKKLNVLFHIQFTKTPTCSDFLQINYKEFYVKKIAYNFCFLYACFDQDRHMLRVSVDYM